MPKNIIIIPKLNYNTFNIACQSKILCKKCLFFPGCLQFFRRAVPVFYNAKLLGA